MTKDHKSLFSEAMSDVTPLKKSTMVVKARTKPTVEASYTRQQAAIGANIKPNNPLLTENAPKIGPHDIISHKNPGVQEGVYRKLRLGKYPIEARLDLHRHTIKQAADVTYQFINEAIELGYRTVIIIHGKGDRAAEPGKLKSFVVNWLAQLGVVLAYHSTQPRHGGAGSLYVLLKKSEQQKEDTRDKHLGH